MKSLPRLLQPQPPVPNVLFLAILSPLCCCLPFGLISVDVAA